MVWMHPSEAQWGFEGHYPICDLSDITLNKVEAPTESEIEALGWGEWVFGEIDESEWWTTLDEINSRLATKIIPP